MKKTLLVVIVFLYQLILPTTYFLGYYTLDKYFNKNFYYTPNLVGTYS